MTILERNRRLFESNFLKSVSSAAADIQSNPENEAPEQAEGHRDAPEVRRGHSAEAPDAGVGRCFNYESEFTHGRSQS